MSDPFRLNGPRLPHDGLMGELQSEVSTEAAPLLRFVVRHAKPLVWVIALLLVIVAAVGAWRWHENAVQRDAEIALGRILVSTSGAERIDALERALPTFPSAMQPGVQLEIAFTALNIQDLPKAAAAYAAVYSQDQRGATGAIAALNQADVLQRAGKPDEALAVLDTLGKTAPQTLHLIITEGQARVAEQAGNFSRALACYEDLAKQVGESQPDYIRVKITELKAKIAAKS